jgi:hypothetical protein
MRTCSICSNLNASSISKEIAAGVSFGELSLRYGPSKASLHRHAKGCLKIQRRGERKPNNLKTLAARGCPSKGAALARFAPDAGRCDRCGQLTSGGEGTALDSKSIVLRAERLLFLGENVALRAEQNEDSRLALLAVDRCQKSVEMLAKVAGLLKPDFLVDKRTQTVNVFADLSDEQLRALKADLEAKARILTERDAPPEEGKEEDQKTLAPAQVRAVEILG